MRASSVLYYRNILRSAIALSISIGITSYDLMASAAPQAEAAVSHPSAAMLPSLPNGVYLYGQSAQPDKTGQAYFVFEVRQGKVLGALYMPRSSFDCAYGSFQGDQLALSVVDSYDHTTNPYDIALEQVPSVVATKDNPVIPTVGLQGFQPLNQVSARDRQILNTCKASHQAKVW
jgi:hypothetical protein